MEGARLSNPHSTAFPFPGNREAIFTFLFSSLRISDNEFWPYSPLPQLFPDPLSPFLFLFCFVFTHQVQEVTISSWMCDFPLECDWFTMEQRKLVPSPRSYQLQMTHQLGVRLPVHLHSLCWNLSWLEVVHAVTIAMSSCTPCCVWSLEDMASLQSPITSGSYMFLRPCQMDLWAQRYGIW